MFYALSCNNYKRVKTCTVTFHLKYQRIYLCVRVIGCLTAGGLDWMGFSMNGLSKGCQRHNKTKVVQGDTRESDGFQKKVLGRYST